MDSFPPGYRLQYTDEAGVERTEHLCEAHALTRIAFTMRLSPKDKPHGNIRWLRYDVVICDVCRPM